jgi:formylglycine-generating enzyme required for sulfatase activity
MKFRIYRIPIFIPTFLSAFALCYEAPAQTAAPTKACFELFSEGAVDIEGALRNLADLKLSLDLAEVDGTVSPIRLALEQNYRQKELDFVGYLESHGIMSLMDFFKKLESEIHHQQEIKTQTEQTTAATRDRQIQDLENSNSGRQLFFRPVAAGSFVTGDQDSEVKIEINKSFSMSATLTTQLIWKKVIEAARLRFPNVQIFMELNPDPSKFKGDLHPVEQVSYTDVNNWIIALNQLASAGDFVIEEIAPGFKAGEVFRLPTAEEWEFVVRKRGATRDDYFFGNDPTELDKYAWHKGNSGGSTHPVAMRMPLVLDGHEFFDLHGNVWEWMQFVEPRARRFKKTAAAQYQRIARGGGWSYMAGYHKSTEKNGWSMTYRDSDAVGFRLIKAIK